MDNELNTAVRVYKNGFTADETDLFLLGFEENDVSLEFIQERVRTIICDAFVAGYKG